MLNDQEAEKPALQGQDMPQFATAEYAHIPGTERCRICNNVVFDNYYRVNNQMACAKCAGEAREGQPSDSHAAFARGLLMGGGAAILGLILYAAFTIITNFYIGFVALGVGWLVAKAMLKGSNGIGGRRYQIAAVLLTYFAISVAAVPIEISVAMHAKEKPAEQNSSAGGGTAQSSTSSEQAPNGLKPSGGLGSALLELLMLGLASPFLELRSPGNGLIGLVILFVGLRIAYQLTSARPLEVDGPYPVAAS